MCKNVFIAIARAIAKQCAHIMPCTKNYALTTRTAGRKETGINDVTTSKFKEVLDLLVPSYLISLPKKTKGKTQDFISFVGSKNTSDGQVTKIKKIFLLNISGQ